MDLYRGTFVYSKDRDTLAVHENSYIAVEEGIVEGIYPVLPEKFAGLSVTDFGKNIVIPAFSDLHVHAPQYPQRGLQMDKTLYEWLNDYTFPLEAKYADPEFARAVYDAFVADLILNGTLHAVIFGTIHREATGYLIRKLETLSLNAFVGKVNMDTASPEYLCESTEESLRETELFLEEHLGNHFAKPILTPRFAPTCTKELMTGLGKLGAKYGVGVQTHLVESLWEEAEARRCFPDVSCDTEIYEKAGLLDNGPVIGAHFIFPSENDLSILKKYGGYAVQCPDATVNVIAGIMRTSFLQDQGIRLAYGSDIAGGHRIGIFGQAAKSVQLSKLKAFYEPEGNEAISFARAFYIATKEGGSVFGNVGSLEPGYAFDALVIRPMADPFMEISPAEAVERFAYIGEPKDITARYLRGKKL